MKCVVVESTAAAEPADVRIGIALNVRSRWRSSWVYPRFSEDRSLQAPWQIFRAHRAIVGLPCHVERKVSASKHRLEDVFRLIFELANPTVLHWLQTQRTVNLG